MRTKADGKGIKPPWQLHEGWMCAIGNKQGMLEPLFEPPTENWRSIQVPGAWDVISEMREVEGPVWYRLEFEVSAGEDKERIYLRFRGVSALCHIWLNDMYMGEHLGIWTPFELDITPVIMSEVKPNTLYLKVVKPGTALPLRENLAGFLPDVSQAFGGIWRPVELIYRRDVAIEYTHLTTDVQSSTLSAKVTLSNRGEEAHLVHLKYSVQDQEQLTWGEGSQEAFIGPGEELDLPITLRGEAPRLWDIDDPYLYLWQVDALVDGSLSDTAQRRFGWREILSNGSQILLNGHPLMVRGMLHWGWHSEKIAPLPSRDEIRQEIADLKAAGFNLVKHCLYVPVDEYFELGDEMGMLMWQELPLWQPRVTEELKAQTLIQYQEICRRLHSHPSIFFWTLGCELDTEADANFLEELYNLVKGMINGGLVRDNSGSGECYGGLLKEHADFYDYHFYTDPHFYRDLMDYFAADWREDKPWLYGEFCDSDTVRDLAKVMKDNEGREPWWLVPTRLGIKWPVGYLYQKERMEKAGLWTRLDELVETSNKKAQVYRKVVLEAVRQYKRTAGYVLTSIKDTPMASSAFYNDLGEIKWPTPQWIAYNSDTILTLNWDNRRAWIHGGDRLVKWDRYNYWSGETVRPHLIISHFGKEPLRVDSITWELQSGCGQASLQGALAEKPVILPGSIQELGVMEFTAPTVDSVSRWDLKVRLTGFLVKDNGTSKELHWENSWPLWFYPVISACPNTADSGLPREVGIYDPNQLLLDYPGYGRIVHQDSCAGVPECSVFEHYNVIVATEWNRALADYLKAGGKVIYMQNSDTGFSGQRLPFWREAAQVMEDSPYIAGFDAEGFCHLQWYSLATDRAFMPATFQEVFGNEAQVRPVLLRLDARKYLVHHYLTEVRLGKGILLATTLRLNGGLGDQAGGLSQSVSGQFLLWQWIQEIQKR